MEREKSFRERAAIAIDTTWYSSWHWPKDWHAKALEDAIRRRDRLIEDLNQVQSIIVELRHYVEPVDKPVERVGK